MQNRRPPSFLGAKSTSASYGESEGRMNPCSSIYYICLQASSSSSGLSLYSGRWTGGVSSSKSMLNSCPILTGGSPGGKFCGNMSLYSLRTTLMHSGMSSYYTWTAPRSDFPLYCLATSTCSVGSCTFWISPRKTVSSSVFLILIACLDAFALMQLTFASSSLVAPPITWWMVRKLWITPRLVTRTVRAAQSMLGFSWIN